MNVMIAPDGKPATFDGQVWVSQDGKSWWNGQAWQRIGGRRGPNYFVIGLGLVIVAAVGLVLTGVIKPAPPPPAPPVVMGVTNAKIDSSTEISFDYARPNDCKQLTFEIVFFDKAGRQLPGTYESDTRVNVSGGRTHHYVFYTIQSIPAAATRFTASDVCHA